MKGNVVFYARGNESVAAEVIDVFVEDGNTKYLVQEVEVGGRPKAEPIYPSQVTYVDTEYFNRS